MFSLGREPPAYAKIPGYSTAPTCRSTESMANHNQTTTHAFQTLIQHTKLQSNMIHGLNEKNFG